PEQLAVVAVLLLHVVLDVDLLPRWEERGQEIGRLLRQTFVRGTVSAQFRGVHVEETNAFLLAPDVRGESVSVDDTDDGDWLAVGKHRHGGARTDRDGARNEKASEHDREILRDGAVSAHDETDEEK